MYRYVKFLVLFVLIAATIWVEIGPGISSLMPSAVSRLFMPAEMVVHLDRKANKPAMQAEKDGMEVERAGDRQAAIAYYTEAIALHGPDNATAAQAYRLRAHANRSAGKLQSALADYDIALDLEPDFSAGYRARAEIYAQQGRNTEALKDFDIAIKQAPDSVYAHIGRARALEKLSRADEALAAYTDAVEAAPRSYERSLKLATGEKWRTRLQTDRNHTIAYVLVARGNALRDRGRFEQALSDYEAALQARPDHRNIYSNRGWLHEKQGRVDSARADYEKAASLDKPDDWLKRALERTQ